MTLGSIYTNRFDSKLKIVKAPHLSYDLRELYTNPSHNDDQMTVGFSPALEPPR